MVGWMDKRIKVCKISTLDAVGGIKIWERREYEYSSVKGRACLDLYSSLDFSPDLQPPRESGVGRLVGETAGKEVARDIRIYKMSIFSCSNPYNGVQKRQGGDDDGGRKMCGYSIHACIGPQISTSFAHSSCHSNGNMRCLSSIHYPYQYQ